MTQHYDALALQANRHIELHSTRLILVFVVGDEEMRMNEYGCL